MFGASQFSKAFEIWQDAWIAYGNMALSASEMMLQEAERTARESMNPEDNLRKALTPSVTFSRAYEMASEAARSKGKAQK